MRLIKNYSIKRLTKDLITSHISAILRIDEDVVWERWSIDKFLDDRAEKWNYSLLALSNDQPIGYIIASSKIVSIHIHYIVVHKNWRSDGVGTQMIKELIKISKNSGKKFITLKCYDNNKKAQNYYKKIGFFEISHNVENEQKEFQLDLASL